MVSHTPTPHGNKPFWEMSRQEACRVYEHVADLSVKDNYVHESLRTLALNDLFFFLVFILKRFDANNDWLFDRCREVQKNPDGQIDLWAREHYKSTIITFALTIQNILQDPDITVGIFSHTRPVAKAFLRQIKREFELNKALQELFPEILWENPFKESPKWSEDEGIVVKRKNNAKESTVEAWGLVDGQPTSKHFRLLVYDDVVTQDSVTTPEMIKKVTDAWALSRNLGATGGRTRYIGTRYHFNDTYKEIIERKAAIERRHPATTDGTVDGEPVLLKKEALAQKRREMGPYIFACQMLLNPVADEVQGFRQEWIRTWPVRSFAGMNIYITCDPASEKKKGSDYTVLFVIGLAPDSNYYVIDGVRDRLSLTERANALFFLHRQYRPIKVGYEKYGMQADIEHIQDRMARENYRFDIVELKGQVPKNDRIRKLIPLFESGRMYLPEAMSKVTREGVTVDLVKAFMYEEYLAFPVGQHDDMLDCLARIVDPDLGASFPALRPARENWRHKPRHAMVV